MVRTPLLAPPRAFGLWLVLGAVGLAQCGYWIVHTERASVPSVCTAWDEAARRTLAPLVRQQGIAADRRLLDALATLRRARHDCAAGNIELARRDYEALYDGLAGITRPPLSSIAER